MKIIVVVFAIILAILALFGLATMVFVAICLLDDQEREKDKNNETSE